MDSCLRMDDDDLLGVGISAPPRNTAKISLPDSCIVRKSATGRANLFCTEIPYTHTRCSTSITQLVQRHSLFHSHGQNARSAEDFRVPSAIACWHCCASFDTPPVPLPKDYDPTSDVYIVYGNFCSLSCTKAFILETATFDSSLQLILLERMAREIYGVTSVTASPPRLSLEMFGGPYSISQFRKMEKRCAIHGEPFVYSYMVVEERDSISSMESCAVVGSVRGLRQPTETADRSAESVVPDNASSVPYDVFVASQRKHQSQTDEPMPEAPTVDAKQKKTKKSTSTPQNTLEKFLS